MGMDVTYNVTSNHTTEAGTAYDGYTMSKEEIADLKKRLAEAPKQDHSKELAAFWEHDKAKEFLNSVTYKPVEKMENVGMNRFNDWFVKNDIRDQTYRSMNSSQLADTYLKAYTEIYDEIEKGYADGTRIKYTIDQSLPGDNKVRQMTKEEELAALDQEYFKVTNKIKWMRRDELDSELVKQGKEEAWDAHLSSRNAPKYKAAGNEYGKNTPDDVKDFIAERKDMSADEIRRDGTDFLMQKLSQDMMSAANLFKQQYSQSQPGTFDIANFLKDLNYWK